MKDEYIEKLTCLLDDQCVLMRKDGRFHIIGPFFDAEANTLEIAIDVAYRRQEEA